MIRGLTFQIPNDYGQYLYMILNEIVEENFIWKIDEDEVLNEKGEFYFDFDTYSTTDFINAITSDTYYLIFLNLQAYRKETAVATLLTYNDFLNSDCELAILITDSSYVDVYAKNKNMIETIKNNAERHGFTEIKYITDENDRRENF